MASPTRAFRTADGTNAGAFGPTEWVLLLGASAVWGSSFLWIAIGLDSLHPAVIALARTSLGAMALQFFPHARRRIGRDAWVAILIVAMTGNVAPALLFGFAEQRISSSVAGMIQAATPLMVLTLAIILQRKSPGPMQVVGLFVGFGGAILLASPSLGGADAERVGVLLVLIAVVGYAISSNLTVPLAQEHGSTTLIAWALVVSSVILLPYGLWGLTESTFEWPSVIAVVILGIFGTGLARMAFAMLLSRAGAPRSAMVSYFVPIVAVILGVTFRDDSIGATELVGLAVVLVAARMISRAERRPA
ncbi:MAG: DMT family transporter [Acidimicrobiales bacterium]|nr:DMT family transporter [Acidimicrobiales bacterium]RZV44206.1 MAG: DMT family transporter [Acidimicrobiales bacterium]